MIEVKVYVNQLHGFNDRIVKVCQLLRALYGLKQFPSVWYNTLGALLKNYGISLLNIDFSVYAKPGLIIDLFAGNLLITSGSISEIKVAKAAFYTCF